MVTVYTKPNCQPCRQTKRALDKRNVPYEEVNILESDEGQRVARTMGFTSAPVVVADGAGTWCGFKPDRIAAL
ncbi:glutaredoxin domain-containing protein [Tomitella gaofuii]|uniref:glutaredoxin domain-containing protein n=1 Tax=Tomitella gaofuii TaxID=2760083 RepID=UPI0015FBF727|nr:glutaredoxin domain-containing protein [Tomitella gaofuii]